MRLLIWIAAFVLLGLNQSSLSTASDQTDIRQPAIEFEVKDVTPRQAIAKLAEATGYRIEIAGELSDRRISLRLATVNLVEDLDRLLRSLNYNYVLVWQTDKHLTFYVFGGSNEPSESLATSDSAVTDCTQIGAAGAQLADELLPFDSDNNASPIAEDLVYDVSAGAPSSMRDDELFPQDHDADEQGYDLELFKPQGTQSSAAKGEADLLFPPDAATGLNVTTEQIKEMEEIELNRPPVPPELDELFPPDSFGGQSLTLKEFHSLPLTPSTGASILDQFPPQ